MSSRPVDKNQSSQRNISDKTPTFSDMVPPTQRDRVSAVCVWSARTAQSVSLHM